MQQAVHLLAAAHVMAHLANDPLLRPRERELQDVVIEAVEIGAHLAEDMAHQATIATLDIMQDVEFQEKQLLKLEPQLCPLQGVLVGWQVDVAQRLG